MFERVISLLVVTLLAVSGQKKVDAGNSSAALGICGYEASCSAGGLSGACVSIGSGCCPGGSVTAGLCPGNLSR